MNCAAPTTPRNRWACLKRRCRSGWTQLVRQNIGYFKEWQERVAARRVYLAELATVLDAAWAATRQPFIVADLETTGLNAETDEVLEFAAVQVTPDGGIAGEFSTLVRVSAASSSRNHPAHGYHAGSHRQRGSATG